jgi:hypothetical protein
VLKKGVLELIVVVGDPYGLDEWDVLAGDPIDAEVDEDWWPCEEADEEADGRDGSARMSLESVMRPVSMLQSTSHRLARSSNRGFVTPAMYPGLADNNQSRSDESHV